MSTNRNVAAVVLGIIWVMAAPARAQTDESLLLDPWQEGRMFESTGNFYRDAVAGNSGQPDRVGMTELESTGRVRLTSDLAIAPSVGYDWTEFRLDHELHDGTLAIPRRLDDLSVGGGTPLIGGPDGFLAMTGAIGYAGGDAFGDSNALYARGSIIFGKKIDDDHSLAIWLEYNGNQTLFPDIPIPGIAYAVTVDDTLSYVLGFPNASVTYKPLPRFELHAEWQAVDTIDAKFTWHAAKPVDLFVEFTDDTWAFHADDLPDTQRLFVSDDRLEAGVVLKPAAWVSLLLSGGYSFGRTIDRGFDERDLHRVVSLSNAPFLRMSFTVDF